MKQNPKHHTNSTICTRQNQPIPLIPDTTLQFHSLLQRILESSDTVLLVNMAISLFLFAILQHNRNHQHDDDIEAHDSKSTRKDDIEKVVAV